MQLLLELVESCFWVQALQQMGIAGVVVMCVKSMDNIFTTINRRWIKTILKLPHGRGDEANMILLTFDKAIILFVYRVKID
jgi:hypothetical protein